MRRAVPLELQKPEIPGSTPAKVLEYPIQELLCRPSIGRCGERMTGHSHHAADWPSIPCGERQASQACLAQLVNLPAPAPVQPLWPFTWI
jgi:hypothetical protein